MAKTINELAPSAVMIADSFMISRNKRTIVNEMVARRHWRKKFILWSLNFSSMI